MIKVGVVNENKYNNGISHLLEHVVLRNKKELQINHYFDSIGGKYNAFTGREFTCFYAKVLQEDFNQAFSVLAEHVFNPSFTEEDVRIEKSIIGEEILQYEDELPQKIRRRALNLATGNHPVSFDILGDKEILDGIDSKDLYSYHDRYYTSSNSVISISGNLQNANLKHVEDVLKYNLKNKSLKNNRF